MLFTVINGILLILSVVILAIILKNSKHAPVLRAKMQTKSGEEYRYFTDYAYALGILYVILSALIFLFHVYVGLTSQNWNQLIKFLEAGKDYYYFMAAVAVGNAFLIIPERSIVLEKYQVLFGLLSICWLLWSAVVNISYALEVAK